MKLIPEGAMTDPMPARFLALVDAELARALEGERADTGSTAPEAAPLVDELARMVAAGGKRIRPVFCYWGHRAGSHAGSDADAEADAEAGALAQVGAAIEVLHTAALVHDDLVDASKLRRGEPTSFRRFAEGPPPMGEPFGRSAAMLAGDLAQALADRLLATADYPAERIVRAFEHFNRMRSEAVRGEFLDLLGAATGSITSEEDVRRVGALKSGSYTVVGPLLIGAALAGADPALGDVLRAYGEPLGEAFQLRDDVLGTFGDPRVTGKDPDDDLREGKQTFLVASARRLAVPEARRALDDALGRPDLPADLADRARTAVRDSGALQETLEAIDRLADHARAAVAAADPLDSAVRDALTSLAGLVALREW